MKRSWKIIAVLAALSAAGVGLFLGLSKRQGLVASSREAPQAAGKLTPQQAAAGKAPVTRGAREHARAHSQTGKVARAKAESSTNMPAKAVARVRTEDERRADKMRELLDTGEEKAALRMARELIASEEPDVRSQVLTVLGWIGVRALPEITQLLADGDETIAADALQQWKMAYDEIEDDLTKAELLVTAMGTVDKEEDLESLVMSFSQLPEDVAVRSLVQVIQGSNPEASAVARDHFAFITQGEYSTPEAAELWIIQNVEPPAAPEAAAPAVQ